MWSRLRRLAGLFALCGYSATLIVASLELVPLPTLLDDLNTLAGSSAGMLREATIIPGPALFYDLDGTPVGVLTNCVEIVGIGGDSAEEPAYATPMCSDHPEPALLGGPLDKALVRLHFDGLVYRSVPASGATSGDRIVAAIGQHYCAELGRAGSDPAEIAISWRQAVEDRRNGGRNWVDRSMARWSCESARVIEAEWYAYFVVPGEPS